MEADPHRTQQSRSWRREGVAGLLEGLTILIVDDVNDMRRLIGRILTRAGAEVYSAGLASEARTLLAALKPDVIVTDISMPYEDGISFIKSLRISEREPDEHIPAVALTAFGPELRSSILRAGFEAYLNKPIDSGALISEVRRVANSTPRHTH